MGVECPFSLHCKKRLYLVNKTSMLTCSGIAGAMEDKVKNLGVIFDSRLAFEHHMKSFCSLLNGTLSDGTLVSKQR